MPTGPVNMESTSKSLRVPHNLAEKIDAIAKRDNRSFASTMVEILRANIDRYDEHSRKFHEALAERAVEAKDADQDQDVEEIKGKLLIGKKPKDPAS